MADPCGRLVGVGHPEEGLLEGGQALFGLAGEESAARSQVPCRLSRVESLTKAFPVPWP